MITSASINTGISMKKALITTLIMCGVSQAHAQPEDASTFYKSRYFLAGFLLRAGNVCDRENKRTIKAAFDLLGTKELMMMSKAYPSTTKQWMEEGSANFNTGTMKDGIGATCEYAISVRSRAEEIVKSDPSSR
jgi:hypothetical protein